MSSWLVSLRCLDGRIMRAGRGLEKYGLGTPCVLNRSCKLGPRMLIAEARAQIIQECRDLAVLHAGGKTRHDRTALALYWPHACQHDVGGVARVRRADRSGETEIDPAIGQWPVGLMAAGA